MEAATDVVARSSFGPPRKELLFKVLVIGELGAGKTSLIKRYVHQFFSEHYRATIGVDFALKVIASWDNETTVRLQLWDIAGQERFGNMTRVYYKDAVGAFLVFDVTRSDSFHAVEKWKVDLDSKVLLPDGRPIPCVLLGNKSDVDASMHVVKESDVEAFHKDKGFAGCFLTSAKEGTNVEEAANFLVRKIIDNEKWRSHQQRTNGHDVRDGGASTAFALSHAAGNSEGPRRMLLTREGEEGGTRRKSDCAC